MDPIIRYKKNTDVQQTWREHGWRSPSDDPVIVAKWKFYQTIGTRDIAADEEELLKHQARR
jgi:hypothetical protein